MATKPVYYISPAPATCDLNATHKITDTFVDGRTSMGSWADMCPNCHRQYGVGVGIGRGQKYEKQDDGRWLKTAG